MLFYVPSIAGFAYAGIKIDKKNLQLAEIYLELNTVLYIETEIWMIFSYATVRFII